MRLEIVSNLPYGVFEVQHRLPILLHKPSLNWMMIGNKVR
jgi:hypothetical protein